MNKKAFTLMELLVVMAIVGVLVSLLIPAVQAARSTSRRLACQNRLKQIGIAVHRYHDRQGEIPRIAPTGYEGFVQWQMLVTGDLEQQSVHDSIVSQMQRRVPWDGFHEVRERLACFACPEDSRVDRLVPLAISGRFVAGANYLGVVGRNIESNDGFFASLFKHVGDEVITDSSRLRFGDIEDGLSNTLAVGERPIADRAFVGAWLSSQEYGHASIGVEEDLSLWNSTNSVYLAYHPHDECSTVRFGSGKRSNVCDQFHHWSGHVNGSNFCRGDGSVAFISYDTDHDVIVALATINGQETNTH